MAIILPPDFNGVKYGLSYRLIAEDDAPFIVELRTDPVLSKFISYTNTSVESQINWIHRYKERERLGQEYYLVFFYEDSPVGVCRLYDIKEDHFTFGSWVFKSGAPFFCSMAGAIITKEIAFETLGLSIEIDKDGTHVDNKKVIRFSKQQGMVYNGTREDDMGVFMTGYLEKETFEKNKLDIIRFFS